MKIKTLKIKVENDNQEFDFKEFFTGSNTIYTTIAHIVKEKDGYYWHVFITYAPNVEYIKPEPYKEKVVPKAFVDEVMELLEKDPPQKMNTKNMVKFGLKHIFDFNDLSEFARLRQYGKKSLEIDKEFLEKVIEIARKHRS